MPLKKSPTVYDVAAHAGVSIATVSRVLRGPDKVAAGTRERVLSAVQELEYIPNASARGLAGRRTGVLGLLIPGHDIPATSHGRTDTATTVEFLDDHDNSHAGFLRNRYFEQLVQGAEAAAWRDGYALLIAAGTSVSRDVMLRDLTGRVDGLVVVSRTVPDELIERAAHSVPLVLVAGDLPGTTDSVRVDNRGGMSALARYILRVKPPGPVIYLAGPPNSPDAAARELELPRCHRRPPRPLALRPRRVHLPGRPWRDRRPTAHRSPRRRHRSQRSERSGRPGRAPGSRYPRPGGLRRHRLRRDR